TPSPDRREVAAARVARTEVGQVEALRHGNVADLRELGEPRRPVERVERVAGVVLLQVSKVEAGRGAIGVAGLGPGRRDCGALQRQILLEPNRIADRLPALTVDRAVALRHHATGFRSELEAHEGRILRLDSLSEVRGGPRRAAGAVAAGGTVLDEQLLLVAGA